MVILKGCYNLTIFIKKVKRIPKSKSRLQGINKNISSLLTKKSVWKSTKQSHKRK